MRELLLMQLEIPWSLATRHYLPGIGEEMVHWEPSPNVSGLREHDGHHYADWPDEESPPLPDATIGWLLCHMEWWWTDAVHGARVASWRATRTALPGPARWRLADSG